MIKNELAKAIVAKAENVYTNKEVIEILDAYEAVVKDTLKAKHDEKVPFGKLGKFSVKDVPAKSGVSAINGKEWYTEAHSEITFKLGKVAKQL